MANTIRMPSEVTIVDATNTQLEGGLPSKIIEISTDSTAYSNKAQVVGTSAEGLDVGDCATAGFCVIRNNHATAIISVGYDDTGFVELWTIPPGGESRLSKISIATTIQLKSDTAATEVVVMVYELS